MLFDTQYAYYMQESQTAEGIFVWRCTTDLNFVLEIGTGALIQVGNNQLYREDSHRPISRLRGELLINNLDIRQGQLPLITATAFRMKWLNPFDKVEVLTIGAKSAKEIIFPNNEGYRAHEDRCFINALTPYTCLHKRRESKDES